MLHTTKRSTGATDAADEEWCASRHGSYAGPVLHAAPAFDRGYHQLYGETVNQANLGTDLDLLRGSSGPTVTREPHWEAQHEARPR